MGEKQMWGLRGLAQSVCILSDEHVMKFPNYSAIYEYMWVGNLDISHIKDAAAATFNIQAHQPRTFRDVAENLICFHNFNCKD
jgi:hypothetical protein